MSITAAAIGAGGSLLGGLFNIFGNKSANKNSQQYANEVYAKQRRDYLTDWQRQNEYNSPQAQMQRFQEAGLNKNLIYGQGSAGNAQPIGKAQQHNAQFQPNNYEGIASSPLQFLNSIYDLQQKKAAVDNMKADNMLKLQQSFLAIANADLTWSKKKGQEETNWLSAKRRRGMSETANYFKDFYKQEIRQMKNTAAGVHWSNLLKREEHKFAKLGLKTGGGISQSLMNVLIKSLLNH
ncbi:DNA pilot protein [Microviridae sp.]|nr:DNA pilot protein [Microviridae sp.]